MSYDASGRGKLKTSEYRQKGVEGVQNHEKERHMIFEQHFSGFDLIPLDYWEQNGRPKVIVWWCPLDVELKFLGERKRENHKYYGFFTQEQWKHHKNFEILVSNFVSM